MFHANETTVPIPGGTADVISFGTGERPLVMLPGLRLSGIRGSAGAVSWYYRRFARAFTVYLIDRRDPVLSGCTIHDLADDTAAAMHQLDLRDVCLYGASQGGMIAQDLTISHPELVSRLALAVTASRTNPVIEEVIARWIGLARTKGLAAVSADYIENGYSAAYLKRYRAFLPLALRLQRYMPVERFCTLAAAILTCDTYDRLGEIACPAIVFGGAEDKVVTGEASREIAARLHCPCHLYPALGHEAYNEAPDIDARILAFFLEDAAR